jgi:hypothetical protein
MLINQVVPQSHLVFQSFLHQIIPPNFSFPMKFLSSAILAVSFAVAVFAAGSCDNTADATIFNTQHQSILQDCNTQCATSTDKTCMALCVASELKTSVECSACVQGIMTCFDAKCDAQCNAANSTKFWNLDCFKCGFTQCEDSVHACFENTTVHSGVRMIPEVISHAIATLGACEDAADQPHLTTEATECGLSCMLSSTPVQCIEKCLENDTKFTSGCRTCIANGASCFNDNCSTECTKGLSDPNCTACGTAKCADVWNACLATQAPAKILKSW